MCITRKNRKLFINRIRSFFMKPKVAINGFGRIGRLSLRALLAQNKVDIVAINDLAATATLAHLLKYDSSYGPYPNVTHHGHYINVNGQSIPTYTIADPISLPWKQLEVDIVIEATGIFLNHAGAGKHITAGAKRVIISAPTQGGGIPTVVLGVNDAILAQQPPIISNASCTTNCLAPIAKVLDDNFGIDSGYINTIHAYTADQRLQDSPHKDLRRARAAGVSIIPTSTGAAKAVGLVLPHLQGKLDGIAMRVPVSNGSVVDFTVKLKEQATKKGVNKALQEVAQNEMKGILAYTEEPLVSVDIIGNRHSCIIDGPLTLANGNLVKVVGWYDNEGGYANRIADLVNKIS